jgi:glutathione synthase/RimK-type ligase-like ATP-grasp enzyme
MRVTAVPFSDVSQLRAIERMIDAKPDEVRLHFARACALDDLGRPDDAAAAYHAVLDRDPRHFGALTNLGSLALARGDMVRAWMCFHRAFDADSNDVIGRLNLAQFYVEQGAYDVARLHYDFVIANRPGDAHANLHANNGLAALAEREGDLDGAAVYRARAFANPIVWAFPYHGTDEPVRVLILAAAHGGDVVSNLFFDDRVVQRTVMMPESYAANVVLPRHDVIFNGVGEPDGARASLERAIPLVAASAVPVINDPRAVLRTGRAQMMAQLAGIEGLIVPRTVRYRRAEITPERLAADGFAYPLLLRSPGFHAGAHFERAETAADVERVLALLPGTELYAIEYVDAYGSDGWMRKYRVAFVDGALYPVHMALARQWKVHYFSAAMSDHAEHRAEEQRFLGDLPATVGPAGMQALATIARTLGLDFGGVDFGRAVDGRLVVFEANATMAIYPPGDDPRWDYRRAAIDRAIHAVRDMIVRRALTP